MSQQQQQHCNEVDGVMMKVQTIPATQRFGMTESKRPTARKENFLANEQVNSFCEYLFGECFL